MWCCRRKGSLGYSALSSLWNRITATTKNWMPQGLLPKSVVWLSAESVGAIVAEGLVPPLLSSADQAASNTIPLYRELPLIVAIALPLIFVVKRGIPMTQPPVLTVLALSAVVVWLSPDNLVKTPSEIAGFFIHHITTMFASIVGGYAGLALTNSSETFSNYRHNMVNHSLTGRAFEICITPANSLLLKIPRLLARIVFQSIAYNIHPLSDALKMSLRKEKQFGILGPAFTKFLFNRFQETDTKALALGICRKVLPFLTKNQSLIIADQLILDRVNQKFDQLKDSSQSLVIFFGRSIIEYASLISRSNLNLMTEQEIQANLKDLHNTLIQAISQYGSSFALQWLGDQVLWNAQNISTLTQLLCSQLQEVGTYLTGRSIYKKEHLQFLEMMIRLHLKPFILFLIIRAQTPHFREDPLTNVEDIQLASILHHVLFRTTVAPLLPKPLINALQTGSQVCVKTIMSALHRLQGVPPQRIHSTEIIPNYASNAQKDGLRGPIQVNPDYYVPVPSSVDSDYVVVNE